MKRIAKKGLSLALALLMLCSAFAFSASALGKQPSLLAEHTANSAENAALRGKNGENGESGANFAGESGTNSESGASRLSAATRNVSAHAAAFPEGSASVNLALEGRAVLQGEGAIINSTTYVPLRNFCNLAGSFDISWNDSTKTATVKNQSKYITVTSGAIYITSGERCFYTAEPVLNLGGSLYVPVRPLCRALDLDLNWNGATRTVEMKKAAPSTFTYNKDDLYWLARIINAEAGGEPMKGKIAVGNVVLNRVRSREYPNTIYGVIFDRKYGTQFTPAAIGTIYRTPNADSIRAAKICLEGYSLSTEAIFFLNPDISTNFWIVNNRTFCFSIGNHDFYK